MDFELKHLDMLPGEINDSNLSVQKTSKSQNYSQPPQLSHSQNISHKSIVVDDLTQQIEELQNKLKVNYKKIVIYEAENQKLIQEKNSLYFENKELVEKHTLTAEKNKKLLTYSHELEEDIEKLTQQNDVSLKLIEAQKIDLNRLTKFHLKIKNVIKPYVENLKAKISELSSLNNQQAKVIKSHENLIAHVESELLHYKNKLETTTSQYQKEKNSLIQGYEEQIHFLSKEIVSEQEKTLDLQNENLKFKKQLETKHFIENELIKFKRSNDEQLQAIHSHKMKIHDLEQEIMMQRSAYNELKTHSINIESSNSQIESVLESTRIQLTQKLSEIETLSLRLKMFEKLNTNLSLNLKDYQD